MPEGKQIPINPGEYPELQGLTPNREVTFNGVATVRWDGSGAGVITIKSMEFEVENAADREYGELSGKKDRMMMNMADDDNEDDGI